ncbi:MAG: hypothetical protein ACRDJ1_05555 [Actinomycetota bacterium]
MNENIRYRCNACGNLTRFDVIRSARTREFWHFSLAGDATVEETETLEENLERIECRWCGAADQIEQIPRVGAEEPQR